MDNYNTMPLIGLIIALYFLSRFLVYKKMFSTLAHRRLWNSILALSFFISASAGVVIAFAIDQKLTITWYTGLLWWHVEMGIAMTIIAVFHFFWHLNYYSQIIKSLKKRKIYEK